MALAAYHHLLRGISLAFRQDYTVLMGARAQARQTFEQNRALPRDSEELAKAIEHAESVAQVLRENVVQGQQQGKDNLFKLRIHQHTERGDNDSVKIGGTGAAKGQQVCCGGSS